MTNTLAAHPGLREKRINPNYLLEVLYCFERRRKKKLFPRKGALHYMVWFGGKGLDVEEA